VTTRVLERASAAWLRFLSPRRIRTYPAIALGVLLLVDLLDAGGAFGKSSQQRPFGGDFLGFYAAGALVSRGGGLALNDAVAQQRFQEQLLGHGSDQVALWVSPPYFAWLFAPFARLPYLLSLTAFLALSVAALWAAFRALQRELALGSSALWLLLIATQYYPTLHWFLNGQITGVWLSVLTAAFLLLRQRRDTLAGFTLSLFACKPTLALGLAVALLVAGRVRTLLAAALGGSLFVGLGFLTVPEAMRGYIQSGGALVALVRSQGYNTAGLHGSFEFATLLLDGLSPRLASAFGVLVALGFSALIARIWWRKPWQPGTRAWDLAMAATFALGVILSPHLFVYDLMLLLLPLFILFRHFPRQGGLPLSGGKLLGLVALNWGLSLLGPVLTVAQQEATRHLFGVACAIQLGVVTILLAALAVAREAERLPSPSRVSGD
jgi:hypothetical protein